MKDTRNLPASYSSLRCAHTLPLSHGARCQEDTFVLGTTELELACVLPPLVTSSMEVRDCGNHNLDTQHIAVELRADKSGRERHACASRSLQDDSTEA